MCSVGLKCPKTGLPVLKPTRILSTDRELIGELRSCTCPDHQSHAHLEGTRKGKNLTHYEESYPAAFCSKIAKIMARRDSQVCADNDVLLNTDAEADAEADSERSEKEAGSGGQPPRPNPRVYAAMVQKLHVNTGHASVPHMLRLAHRSKAPQGVIDTIKKFRCPVCEELQLPPSHRVASLRHTETPNDLVGLDVVQVELKRGQGDQIRSVDCGRLCLTLCPADCAATRTGFGQPCLSCHVAQAIWSPEHCVC